MKLKKMIFIAIAVILVAAAAVVFFLRDTLFPPKEVVEEEPEPITAPIQYILGENVAVLALPTGENVLVYEEEPVPLVKEEEPEDTANTSDAETEESPSEDSDEEEASEEEVAEEKTAEEEPVEEVSVAVAYRYEGMSDVNGLISAYTALLATEDLGYVIAGEDLKEAEKLPNFNTFSGAVYLTHVLPKPEEGADAGEQKAVAMRLEWNLDVCTVTVDLVPAYLTKKPQAATAGYGQVLTFTSAVDKIYAMHPSVLELEGESMKDYKVYSRDGLVMVNDQTCMRLDVYMLDEKIGTNVAAGTYFVSADGLRLYRFNEMEQSMRELDMNKNKPVVSQDVIEEPAE